MKEDHLTGKTLVALALPILDDLAGEKIRGGEPTGMDPLTMKPPGVAVIYALGNTFGAGIEAREISRLIRGARKPTEI